MKKLLLVLLCFTILFSGCITTRLNKTVNRCKTADCVQMNFGPPTHIQKNGEFGEIWTYGGATYNEGSNQGIKQETNVYINSTSYKDNSPTMTIYIDKNNKVYKRDVEHFEKYNYLATSVIWVVTIVILIIGGNSG